MKIAICDDNQEELIVLENALTKYRDDTSSPINIVSFLEASLLIAEVENNVKYDLYILDIVMPGTNGIEIAKYLRNKNIDSPIVFLTSSKEFALDAFGVKAADYLIKPLDPERLIEICSQQLLRKNQDNTILLTTKNIVQSVDVAQIIYCEVISKTNYYHLNDSTVFKTTTSFKQVLETLSQFDFFYQVHRSIIINFNYVKKLDKDIIYLVSGVEIKISREKVKIVRDAYFNYVFKGRCKC